MRDDVVLYRDICKRAAGQYAIVDIRVVAARKCRASRYTDDAGVITVDLEPVDRGAADRYREDRSLVAIRHDRDSPTRAPSPAIPALAPRRLTALLTVGFSMYEPAVTLTVSPFAAASMPRWMLGVVVPPGAKKL